MSTASADRRELWRIESFLAVNGTTETHRERRLRLYRYLCETCIHEWTDVSGWGGCAKGTRQCEFCNLVVGPDEKAPEYGPHLATADDVIEGRARYGDTPGGHADRKTKRNEGGAPMTTDMLMQQIASHLAMDDQERPTAIPNLAFDRAVRFGLQLTRADLGDEPVEMDDRLNTLGCLLDTAAGYRGTTWYIDENQVVRYRSREDTCSAVSPESQIPCILPDAQESHAEGHKSAWVRGARAGWSTTEAERERWDRCKDEGGA